ncbi:ABC transporter ATP-binding protein [bacterium]|nr:ABC transporter ATP-binding protein [bacterium]
MPVAVEIRDLHKSYRRRLPWASQSTTAVDGLELQVPRGEIFGLLGSNGAGKTTTIKMIAGLVVPDSGSISFPAWQGRPQLGAVLEGSRNLYWRLSVWENISYFGELKGVYMNALRPQASELLEMFGLADKRDRPAQTLSRGMQQKLAVVLALLGEPELLLLDEPTLGLDVSSSLTIQRLLKDLVRERGLTIIVTTHQMEVAQSICRRVGIMKAGRIELEDSIDSLVDLFGRSDYLMRMTQDAYAAIQPELSAYRFEQLEEPRPGQVSLRIQLADSLAIYPLLEILARHKVELSRFSQEQPTLEEIFVKVTAGRPEGRP